MYRCQQITYHGYLHYALTVIITLKLIDNKYNHYFFSLFNGRPNLQLLIDN